MSADQLHDKRSLNDRNRLVWRRVAAHANGITSAALREELAGQIDAEPQRVAVSSLRQMEYLQFEGAGSRWGKWRINPDKIPLGETAPAWLAAAAHDAELDAKDAKAVRRHQVDALATRAPASVFHLAQQMVASPAAPTAPAHPTSPAAVDLAPMFQLDSTGCLVLINCQCPGDLYRLPPGATRALFAWLDRLGGTALSRLSEAA